MPNKKTKRKKPVASEWNKFCRPYMAAALTKARKAYRKKHKLPDERKLASLRKQKAALALKIKKELNN